MTETEHLLSCLAEECAEVGQRVSKALRFGLREIQPGQALTNVERIAAELQDVMAVAGMLASRGVLPDANPKALVTKIQKVEKYMEYARSIGTIK